MDGTAAGMAILGGALIALSSSLHYIIYGRITGLSGFLFNVVGFKFGPLFPLRGIFLVGMVSIVDFFNQVSGKELWGKRILDYESEINPVAWAIGGILIGLGVRCSGGCTSGHGVCGLPRLSKRSLIAVLVFMSFGVVTATSMNYLPEMPPRYMMHYDAKKYYQILPRVILSIYQLAALIYIGFTLFTNKITQEKVIPLAYLAFGLLFGLGLLISGMCSRNKILAFLTLNQNWDPSLMLVMATAVGINLLTFQLTIKRGKPLIGVNLDLPDTNIETGVYTGAAMFGVGWGITGLCPGPALTNITVLGNSLALVLLIFAGQALCDFLEARIHKVRSA